ncbi:MAG: PLP-dependent aminotransferase family protein [Oscillospiraceae bacterium]|nr:PLP-dependent aminotransferase family protein [Oscillospiraceae bacterium]
MEYKISEKMKNIKPSAIREIFKSLTDPSVISFAAGNPSPDAFPVEQIKEISQIIYENMPVPALQYGISEGYAPLIEKVRLRIKEKFNIGGKNDATLIVSGGQQGIDLTGKVMCNEGDAVICERPSFVGAINSFKANGAKPVQIDMESDGTLEKALAENKNAKIIYLIPTFQNPSGSTMPLKKRKSILETAKKYGAVILEDNPYGELRFGGEEVPTIKSMDTDGVVVYCSSFSKIIAPAIRVGYLIAPKEIAGKIVVAKQGSDVHTNMYFQILCDLFMEKFDIDAHIEKIRALYKEKCMLMLDEMHKKFDSLGIKYTSPEGGLFLWCSLPEGMDLAKFVQTSLEKKVAVVPGGAFLADPSEASRSFRVNFSYPSKEQIIAGIGILADVAHRMK